MRGASPLAVFGLGHGWPNRGGAEGHRKRPKPGTLGTYCTVHRWGWGAACGNSGKSGTSGRIQFITGQDSTPFGLLDQYLFKTRWI